MRKKEDFLKQFIQTFQDLHKEFPSYTLGQHLSTAFADYGDLWGCSDKEIVFALDKYKSTLELDFVPVQDVEMIIRDGENLFIDTLNEEDESDDLI